MPCQSTKNGIICYSNQYRYKGYYFDKAYPSYYPLKKDGNPSLKTPKGFWDMIDKFANLSNTEKEKYLV